MQQISLDSLYGKYRSSYDTPKDVIRDFVEEHVPDNLVVLAISTGYDDRLIEVFGESGCAWYSKGYGSLGDVDLLKLGLSFRIPRECDWTVAFFHVSAESVIGKVDTILNSKFCGRCYWSALDDIWIVTRKDGTQMMCLKFDGESG